MTAVSKLRGTQLYIKVSDGASPEVFAHPCLINAKRGIKFTCNLNKVIIPDCDSPDDPAWQEVIKDALGMSIDGAGVFDNKPETVSFYDAWFRSPDTKNIQVWLGTLGYWQAPFMMGNWEITGERNTYCDASIALESSGILPAFIVS